MHTRIISRDLWLVLCFAVVASPASAACITPPLSAELIKQFKSNPGGLIPTPDTDARTVEVLTRDLAGTDPTLASDLVHIAEGVRQRFRSAIAAGLAQAALACMGTDQQAALQIQQAVASFQDGQFQALFAAVVGDLSTATTAAAESAATGSAGSVAIVNPNTSPGTKNNPGSGVFFNPASFGPSNATTNVFAVVGPTASAGSTTNGKTASAGGTTMGKTASAGGTTMGKTAANAVSATR
jgi:hypothetical protein